MPETLMTSPFHEYFREKKRDLPGFIDPAAGQLQVLDRLITARFSHRGDATPEEQAAIDAAIEAVLSAPKTRWTRDTLMYRIRQIHYS